jgi:hypothetical protein
MAQSEILIAPTRIVFDSARSEQQIRVLNVGNDTLVYNVSFVEMRMKDNGKLEPLIRPEAGQLFASNYISVSAKRLTLVPGQTLALVVKLDTPPHASGEYRSHLLFKKETVGVKNSITQRKAAPGITLPIIIREGPLTAKVEIADMSVQVSNDSTFLYLTLHREGNKSVFGDLEVDLADAQGNPIQVGSAKGVAVYTPNASRKFRILLKKMDGFSYRFGKLNVAFKTSEGQNEAQLAQREMVLNK